jgi:hypothetical protein
VHVDLAGLREAAHREGATTNDAVLVAVADALRRVLAGRGERVDAFAVAVPVAGRTESGAELGNLVSPLLVSVPATGPLPERLGRVSAQVRAGRDAAGGEPPIALLGWLFRPMASLGGFDWYMRHQRRLHTLVSHVRGPAEPVAFDGVVVRSAIPVGVGPAGNVTVAFEVLSYAGELVVTAIVDPERFPDLEVLLDALRSGLATTAGRGR